MKNKKRTNRRMPFKVTFIRDKSLDNVQWELSPEKEKAINEFYESAKDIDLMKAIKEAEAASEE